MKLAELKIKLTELNGLELSPEDEKRLWKKFQLEWNYHSNHIEGNTLTYGETELLFNHGKVAGTHSLRDVEEMKAHDVAINQLRALSADDRPITEGDIRQLNTTLLKEPFFKDAMTPDGQPTQKQIFPGQYKTTPNNVLLKDGSLFPFSPPEDVPNKMHELVTWLRDELEAPTLHPIETATILHHRFVLIHPFDDGNGRTARLLVNYVLLRNSYPPVIVKTETKPEYLAALQLADAGELKRLTDFLAKELDWSLDISIQAARGESIAEQNDLDKEIAIFVKNQTDTAKDVLQKNTAVLNDLAKTTFVPFLELLKQKLDKFRPLFATGELSTSPVSAGSKEDLEVALLESIRRNIGQPFSAHLNMNGYKGDAPSPFGLKSNVSIHFGNFEYQIHHQNNLVIKKLYSEPMLNEEIQKLVSEIQAAIFAEIKKKSGQES